MYGASKLACEGLISAYCHNFGFKSWIYRFANVIGKRITHGVILDFYRKLNENPAVLEVLGDGRQSKPYIAVSDCVEGILFGFRHSSEQVNLFNLGTEGATSVSSIAQFVLNEMKLNAELKYSGGIRGWPGDVHTVRLDMGKMRRLGWKPMYSSDEAVRLSVSEIISSLRQKHSES